MNKQITDLYNIIISNINNLIQSIKNEYENMKKKSFFGKLAGNLRFDDTEKDVDDPYNDFDNNEEGSDGAIVHEEEVGELPVDMYETPNEIIIQTLIAGVLPEHLSISITRDNVTIFGKREESRTVTDDQYHTRELYWGAFSRNVSLPAEVEIDNAEAIERHGMLIIKLPKLDKRRKASLKIKSI